MSFSSTSNVFMRMLRRVMLESLRFLRFVACDSSYSSRF
jgi:hypothetical protein